MTVSAVPAGTSSANITMAEAQALLAQVAAETAPERAAATLALSAGSHDVYLSIERAESMLTSLDVGTGTVRHHTTALEQARAAQAQLKQLALIGDLPVISANHVREAYHLVSKASVAISGIDVDRGPKRYFADTTPIRTAIDTALGEIPDGGAGASEIRRRMFEASRTLTALETGDGNAKALTTVYDNVAGAVNDLDAAETSGDAAKNAKLRAALTGVQDAVTRLRLEPALRADTAAARTGLATAREQVSLAVTQAEHGGVLNQVDSMLGMLMREIDPTGEGIADKAPIGPSRPKIAMPNTTPTLERALSESLTDAAVTSGTKILKTLA